MDAFFEFLNRLINVFDELDFDWDFSINFDLYATWFWGFMP